MISHSPWIGCAYDAGIASQPGERIAIVGHSHYSDEPHDEQLTIRTVKAVVNRTAKHAFFTSIPAWFGYNNCPSFWQAVMFFNFLPDCVGSRDEKFGRGTPDQIASAKRRFRRLIDEHRPHRVFVVTTKGWKDFPESDSEPEGVCKPLGNGNEFTSDFNWDTYSMGSHVVKVIGLRHPLGANRELMQRAVAAGLKV